MTKKNLPRDFKKVSWVALFPTTFTQLVLPPLRREGKVKHHEMAEMV